MSQNRLFSSFVGKKVANESWGQPRVGAAEVLVVYFECRCYATGNEGLYIYYQYRKRFLIYRII